MQKFEAMSLEQAREHENRYDEIEALYDNADDLDDYDRATALRLVEQARMSYYAGIAALSPFKTVD